MAKIPIIMLNVKRESNLKEDGYNIKKEGTEKRGRRKKIDEREGQRQKQRENHLGKNKKR